MVIGRLGTPYEARAHTVIELMWMRCMRHQPAEEVSIFICADCDKDITNEDDHECQAQRTANRRAQAKQRVKQEV